MRNGIQIISAFVLLCMLSIKVQAQQAPSGFPPPPTFKMNLIVMPQTTFMINKSEEDEPGLERTWKGGMAYGLSLGFMFHSEKFCIDLGVLHSKQGINITTPTTYYGTYNYYGDITLEYIKVPVTLNYYPLKKQGIPLVLSGGFQFSNLIKADISTPDWYHLANEKDWFNPTTIDVVAAIGLDGAVAKNLFLNVRARMDYSIGDSVDRGMMYPGQGSTGSHWRSDRTPTHNITIGLLAGIEYRFGKKK